MNKKKILEIIKNQEVKFIKLEFTDIFGVMKNINISVDQLEKALNNEIMFDGSSIDGFARIEESDMYLYPDLDTFLVLPKALTGKEREARFICDVYTADGKPFAGDPRFILKKVVKAAAELGYQMNVGPELEFFLFKLDTDGHPTLTPSDKALYFDMDHLDTAHLAKKEMCLVLQDMGFKVEATHHECAPGQHEIDFKYEEALKSADNIITFKSVVKQIAQNHGLYATFMPKPIYGIAGSGMHLNQSLAQNGINVFADPKDELGLSKIAYYYIAGILNHAKGLSLLVSPQINSYKRLVAGFEAPVNIAWAIRNRSPLIRVPSPRGESTRIEMRNPDPSCNPYLAIAGALAAGLDGIKKKEMPPKRIDGNIYELSEKELTAQHIETLPENLGEALEYMLQDELIKKTLGQHITERIASAAKEDWTQYRQLVTPYEVDKYLHL